MMQGRKRVLVYGASGIQGGAVAQRLLEVGHRVRGISRQPDGSAEGIEMVAADLDDMESLERASEGVDAVFLVLPSDYGKIAAWGRNAVDAARRAGVRHLVLNTSSRVPTELTNVIGFEARRQLESYLRSSDLSNIVLKPTFYMENFLGPWTAPGIVEHGVVASLNPRLLRASWISVRDMAAFSVAALERPELAGRSFDVGGPEVLDGDAVAERFSTALGRPMTYSEIPVDTLEEQLAAAVGPEVASGVASSYRWSHAHPNTELFTTHWSWSNSLDKSIRI